MPQIDENWFFTLSKHIFFGEISRKFKVELLKNFMDFFYIIYEHIGCKFEILSNNYIILYDELVEKEITSADISSEDRVLVIGGGSIPATPVLIAKKTKAKVTVIDKDPLAIKNASSFIKKHNLEKNIDLKHAEGMIYPVENFNVIFVLYGIKKNKELLNYIYKNTKKDSLIIFRAAFDSLKNLKECTNFLSNIYEVKEQIESEKFSKTISFLLKIK